MCVLFLVLERRGFPRSKRTTLTQHLVRPALSCSDAARLWSRERRAQVEILQHLYGVPGLIVALQFRTPLLAPICFQRGPVVRRIACECEKTAAACVISPSFIRKRGAYLAYMIPVPPPHAVCYRGPQETRAVFLIYIPSLRFSRLFTFPSFPHDFISS